MWRWPWAWRTSTHFVTSATHTSALAFMGQASPSGVEVHLLEGDTSLQPADPSKSYQHCLKPGRGWEGCRWAMSESCETWWKVEGQLLSSFLFEHISALKVEYYENTQLFQIREERLHCGYSACIYRCKIQSWKRFSFSSFLFSAWTVHATWQEGDKTGSIAKESHVLINVSKVERKPSLWKTCWFGGTFWRLRLFIIKFSLNMLENLQ